jgi:hypothetical protein
VRYRLRLAMAAAARQAGQRWVVGCARWAWTHRPRRQADGLVEQERQP